MTFRNSLRNSPIVGAYNDLQYANVQPVIQQRPVEALTELYRTRGEKAKYVLDKSNILQNAIASTPHTEVDKNLVQGIAGEVTRELEDYAAQGDFENRVIDIDRLSADAARKLQPIQARKKSFDSWMSSIMELDKDGTPKHSVSDQRKAVYLAKKQLEENPLEWNEDLKTYTGSFSPLNVPANINFSEQVSSILDDWKANKIVLKDKHGNPLQRIPGTGKLRAGTMEYVDDSELIQAAKSHLMNDPNFIDKYRFDMDYEMSRLMEEQDKEELDLDDVRGIVSGDLQAVGKELGIDTDRPLQEQVASGDISADELYRRIRLEQMTNSAIKLGVSKEAYTQYEDKYLTDDLLLKALDWQNKNRASGKKPIDLEAGTSIHKIKSENIVKPSDYNSILSSKDASKASIQSNQAALNTMRKEGTGTPQQRQALENRIKSDRDALEESNRQLNYVKDFVEAKSGFNFIPYYEEYSNKIDEERLVYQDKGNTLEQATIDIPKLSYEDYKDQVISKFVNGDTFTVVEDFITGIGQERHRLDVAAEALKDAFGGDIDTQPYTIDYHTFLIDEKDGVYGSHKKDIKKALTVNPETFVYGDMNLPTLLKEEYDIDIKDVDLEKSQVYPIIESVNKQPGYIIDIVDKDGNKTGTKVTVNYVGGLPGSNGTFRELTEREAYNRFKDKNIRDLDLLDKSVFTKLALSWIDNSFIGEEFDNLNLDVAKPGIPVNFKSGNINFNIVPQLDSRKENPSYDDIVYNLTDDLGRTNLVRTLEDGTQQIIWDNVRPGDIPVDYEDPSKIKEVLASTILADKVSRRKNVEKVNPYEDLLGLSPTNNNLQDIASIFKTNVRQGSTVYMNKDYSDKLKTLVNNYPTLFVYNSSKDGNSLLTKINGDGLALFKTDKETLKNKYGIDLVQPVDDSGNKVTNFSDADYFYIQFSD